MSGGGGTEDRCDSPSVGVRVMRVVRLGDGDVPSRRGGRSGTGTADAAGSGRSRASENGGLGSAECVLLVLLLVR